MAALLLGAAACPGRVSAQPSTGAVTARDASPRDSVNCNPERAEIVSRDVHNFWRAYDAARRAPDSAGSGAAYRDRYIRAGFPGLADWTRSHPADQGAVVKVPVSRDWTMVRISDERDHRFRSKPIPRFARSRSGISLKPITAGRS